MIRFSCPTCGKKIVAPNDSAGKRGSCACGHKLTVPTTVVASVPTSGHLTTQNKPPQPSKDPRFFIGFGLVFASVLLHFATCYWGTENLNNKPPLVTLQEGVVVDKSELEHEKFLKNLMDRSEEESKKLLEEFNKLSKESKSAADSRAILRYIHIEIDSQSRLKLSLLDKQSDSRMRAYGRFGLYSRGARDSGLIIGVVGASIFLISGAFMIVWGYTGNKNSGVNLTNTVKQRDSRPPLPPE